jgi:enoyl-CoA hydratase/carnithine racemase
MNYTTIFIEKRDDRIAVVTLNRPEVRNAINPTMRAELLAAIAELEVDPEVRVVIVTGGDKIFAAGADIAAMVDSTALEMFGPAVLWDVTLKMEESRKPYIAAVTGYCLGGGCELALACDMRIATESAQFGQPEINIGIIPGGGGTVRLTRLVGMGKACELVLTGKPIPASEALAIGLVNKVVPEDRLMEEALAMAKSITRLSPVAVGLAKYSLKNAAESDIRTGKSIERACFSLAFASEDQTEGMRAFLEKRKPNYQGK